MHSQELYQVFKAAMIRVLDEREIRSQWAYIWPRLREEDDITAQTRCLSDMISQLEEGWPLQYVVGYAVFYDMELEVNRDVLIPRPETEELVALVTRFLKGFKREARLLDVGTGSGCIPIAIGRQNRNIKLSACDISNRALLVAQRNAQTFFPSITFFHADMTRISDFSSFDRWDVIVSNPPYVEKTEGAFMSASTRYEPEIALFAEGTALWAYRHLCQLGLEKLTVGGRIFLEINAFYAEDTLRLFQVPGYSNAIVLDDMQGKKRFLVAERIAD